MEQINYRNNTLVPEGKMFWLDQYKELKYAAKKIANEKRTSSLELQIIISEYFDGAYRGKGQLEEALFKKILELAVPRDKPGNKYKEQELF